MAQAVLWTMAEAVAEWLNGQEFSLPFTARRQLKPKATLEQVSSLRVTVVPRGNGRSLLTRGQNQVQPQLDIGLQQSFRPDDEDLVEDLVSLGEELTAAILGRAINVDGNRFSCMGAEFTVFDPESIEALGVFTGVVTATFLGTEDR